MAERDFRLRLKRSNVPTRPLPTDIKLGEPIINMSDGILFFSGNSASSPSFVPSDNNSGYFEVGSNLNQLKIRDKITSYSGFTNLTGKFLRGSSSGFILDDISNITTADSYVTGATFNSGSNILTLSLNDNKPSVTAYIDITSTTGLTLNHNTDLTNLQGGSAGEYYHTTQSIHDGLTGATNPSSGNPFATLADISAASGDTQQVKVSANDTTPGFLEDKLSGGTNVTLSTLYDGSNERVLIDVTIPADNDIYVTGNTSTTSATNSNESYTTQLTYNTDPSGAPYTLSLEDTFVTGGTVSGTDLTLHKNDGSNSSVIDLSALSTVDTFVTGGTYNASTNSDNSASVDLTYNQGGGAYNLPTEDTYLSGGTLNGNTLLLTKNDGSQTSVDLSSLSTVDTYVTGSTWDSGTNTLSIDQNEGQPSLTTVIDSFSGPITVNGDFTVTGGTTTVCDIIPNKTWNVDGGCDIGAVGSRFLNVYARYLKLGTSTTILGDDGSNFEMSGNTGDFIFRPADDFISHAHFNPGIDLGYDLGTLSERWNTLNVGSINATGLTISGLGAGRVVYTNGSGGLTTEAGFEYDDTLDRITVGNLAVNNASGDTASIGQGGLVIGSGGAPGNNPGVGNLLVHGNLTVYGTETIVDTTNLYIEDNNITLNYNPTGDTSATYLGAGFTIQDGDGAGTDITLSTGQLYLNGNINSNSEYTAATGAANLGFFTSMNDILIRNTNNNSGAPDGKRVLAEDDCLDGGTY